jgi:uncharacterized SAM-binding protein YcdF (DUF218 family)
MYRAKLLFEKQGFQVIPYKVDYRAGRNEEIVILDFFPNRDRININRKWD